MVLQPGRLHVQSQVGWLVKTPCIFLCNVFVKYHIEIWLFIYYFPTKVPESEACSICRAFWEEFSPCLTSGNLPKSTTFLRAATRLSKTGHENRFANSFADYGLAAPIPMTFLDVGLKGSHPVLHVWDIVHTLDVQDKLDILLQGNGEAQFEAFWKKWQQLQPKHPIYHSELHKRQLGSCVPIQVHCDEGTTLKKKAIMILQIQPMMGKGTRKRKSSSLEPGCNMLGHSMTNRILWSVMLARVYSGKKLKNQPLKKLIGHLAQQLTEAFYTGIEISKGQRVLFLVPISMKGDWPALVKVGGLTRHFGRQVTGSASSGHGICHFCQADRPGFERWHDLSWGNMDKLHHNCPLPWDVEPDLVAGIGLPQNYKAQWFRIDLFHTLHKGLFADIAANAIAFWRSIFMHCFVILVPQADPMGPEHCWKLLKCSLLAKVSLFDHEVLGELAFDKFCEVCFAELKEFCSATSHTLHMTGLTRTLLGFPKSSSYPVGTLVKICLFFWCGGVPVGFHFILTSSWHTPSCQELVQGCWHNLHPALFGGSGEQSFTHFGGRYPCLLHHNSHHDCSCELFHAMRLPCWALSHRWWAKPSVENRCEVCWFVSHMCATSLQLGQHSVEIHAEVPYVWWSALPNAHGKETQPSQLQPSSILHSARWRLCWEDQYNFPYSICTDGPCTDPR